MKKIVSVIMAALLLLSMGAFVTAQAENADSDEAADQAEVVDEVAVMNSESGAKVRLMQLQKSIAKNVAVGERVVESLLEDNPNASVSGLNNALAELQVIKEEVEEMTANESANASELAEQFVTIKEEARNISSEFKSNVHEQVPEEQREQIRERAANATSEEVEQTREQLKERIREHNAEQVRHVLSNMGVENESLVSRVRIGEMNVGQAVSQVAKQFRGLGQEQKQQAQAKIKEERAERNVHAKSVVEKAQKNMPQKMKQRAEKRQQKVQEKLEQVRDRVRANLPEHVKDKVTGKMGPSDKAGPNQSEPGAGKQPGENTTAPEDNTTSTEDNTSESPAGDEAGGGVV